MPSRERRSSTGRLSPEDRRRQDDRYEKKSHYDYVIVGSGMAALTAGSLLASRGASVCVLESHDVPGGYGHTFKWGDFQFNAQLHYIWGCGEGEVIKSFVKKLQLDKTITFENYDPDGYDHIRLPDGRVFRIPCGFDKMAGHIEEMFPGEGVKARKFLNILDRFNQEVRYVSVRHDYFWKARVLANGPRLTTLLRYKDKTLQDVLDECGLSPQVQTIFTAISGTFLAPPKELSVIAYGGVFSGFNTGAYYPTKHFKHFIDSIVSVITEKDGCSLFLETPVTNIHIEKGQVAGVTTADGKRFTAGTYICNMDPQAAIAMAGPGHFPRSIKKKASYEYSHTSIMLYLGLSGIDLREHGYGNYNRWHLEQWDMNRCWDETMAGNYDRPWMFMSTPTLHTHQGGIAPPGSQILEILTLANYDLFADMKQKSKKDYEDFKFRVADRLLDTVEQHYVPGLRRHIVKWAYGSPTTNEDFVLAPRGNAYGSHMTPSNVGLDRMRAETGVRNLYWCSASSGHAGIFGTVRAGVLLYMNLTRDWFWNPEQTPPTDVLVRALKSERVLTS